MNYLMEQQEKANKNLENVSIQSRLEDRFLWDKLIMVVFGILGFSLTLFSTDSLSLKIINSCSKYYLLTSWLLYSLSLLIGFFLLKRETLFQRQESLRNSLYAMDTAELLDERTLKVKEDKKEQFIALQVLRGKSFGSNDFWSKNAMGMYDTYKKDLNSFKLIKEPEKLYSYTDKTIISWSERIFYVLIILATISLLLSVISLIL